MASENRKFMYVESTQVPLKEVPYGDLKENIIDPTTNKPYQGIVLEGPFADLKATPNNNKRIYDVDKYLELLQKLKQQIFSHKGVYGELEHPEKYSVDFNNVSHKILDVWFDKNTQMVWGKVMLLNTPKGKIAQEIIRSGGQLAISARAAGEEIPQKDGTYRAVTKLLTTYDLVYHPGFSEAVLEFKQLNESQQFIQREANVKRGFGFMIYQDQLNKIPKAFKSYISLNESEESVLNKKSKCFLEWLCENSEQLDDDKSDSKTEEESDQKVMEDNEPSDEKKSQQQLKSAAQKDLKESKVNKFKKGLFFQEVDDAQKKLRNKSDKAYFDNAAGFVETGIDTTGIPTE